MSQQSGKAFELTGKHVLLTLIAFFAVVFAVNFFFMRVALETHTGVVSDDPYRRGLKYNDTIAAAEKQDELGWRNEIKLNAEGSRLTMNIVDKDGKGVSGLLIKAEIAHPVAVGDDVVVALKESGPGIYEAEIPRRQAGTYIASVEASETAAGNAAPIYRAKERLWLKP